MNNETPATENEDQAPFGEDADALIAAQAEIAGLKDQMLRVAAEAENTKRRAEREANDARARAIEKFARDLMGVADNLSRALQHAPREDADPAVKNLVVGLDMTEKELAQAFERNGLKRVEPARGAKFDPHLHQAMMEQAAEDVGPGGVLQVMQPGYELFGRLVRPAMVIVADKSSGSAVASSEPGSGVAGGYPSNGAGLGGTVDTKA
jgi:molecular chaperone GrpE